MQAEFLRTGTFCAAPDFNETKPLRKRVSGTRGTRMPSATAAVAAKTSENALALPAELSKQIIKLKSTISKSEMFAVASDKQVIGVASVTAAAVLSVESDLQSMITSFLEETLGIGPGACALTFNPGWSTRSMKADSVESTFEQEGTSQPSVSTSFMTEEELQALQRFITGGLCFGETGSFNETEMPRGPAILVPYHDAYFL